MNRRSEIHSAGFLYAAICKMIIGSGLPRQCVFRICMFATGKHWYFRFAARSTTLARNDRGGALVAAAILFACHSEGACVRGNPYPNICKGDRKMKATGIVRRVEEYGIIGQKPTKPHKHYGFCRFLSNSIYTKQYIHSKSEGKFPSFLC